MHFIDTLSVAMTNTIEILINQCFLCSFSFVCINENHVAPGGKKEKRQV